MMPTPGLAARTCQSVCGLVATRMPMRSTGVPSTPRPAPTAARSRRVHGPPSPPRRFGQGPPRRIPLPLHDVGSSRPPFRPPRRPKKGRIAMSILVTSTTRVICQGITGEAGAFHTKNCLEYGTKMVGGVTPGKGGQKDANGLPIFNTVRDAVAATGANATMIFIPPPFAADGIMEAADAGIGVICAITEGIPVLDMIKAKAFLHDKPGIQLIGPNCPGVITAGECKIGIMPGYIHTPASECKS